MDLNECDCRGASAQATVLTSKRHNVNVTTFAEMTYASSDTKIATVTHWRLIRSAGAATITATYQGKQATASLTVSGVPARRRTPCIVIASEAPGSTTVKDLVGRLTGPGRHGRLHRGWQAELTGVDGYVDLPNGIISSLTNDL
jgi:hypothetical protein